MGFAHENVIRLTTTDTCCLRHDVIKSLWGVFERPSHLEQRDFLCISSFKKQLRGTYYQKDVRKNTEQTAEVKFAHLPSLSKHLTTLKCFVKITYSKAIFCTSGKGMR